MSHHQVKEFIGSQFADPRKVHAGLAKNNRFSLWIDTERLKTTNQNDESLGMVCALIRYMYMYPVLSTMEGFVRYQKFVCSLTN